MTKIQEQAIQSLGQLFMIGFNGLELAEDTASFISQANIGGVIYFAHNYESPAQIAELSNQVQECRTETPLWIAVDHEGGRVQRFKKGFTKIPSAATVTASGSAKLAFDLAQVMGRELKAVGVNLNFAPVTDIMTNPKNPVIGDRAYGTDEDTVSKYASGILRGHVTAGVQACVKHFPGHGDTSLDSHFALPRVDTPLETLKEREFRPFVKAFKSRCNFVMTAHVIMSAIDKEKPATLSSKVLREVLRKEIRYSKVIVSDDLEMKAITDHYGAEEAPRLAIEAGCDILIYRTETAGRHAYAAVAKAIENGKLSPEVVLNAAQRLKDLKKEVLMPYKPAVVADVAKWVGTPENASIVQQVEEAAKK